MIRVHHGSMAKNSVTRFERLGFHCVWLYVKEKSDKYFSNLETFRGPSAPSNLIPVGLVTECCGNLTTLYAKEKIFFIPSNYLIFSRPLKATLLVFTKQCFIL